MNIKYKKMLYKNKILYSFKLLEKNKDLKLIKIHKTKKNFLLNFIYFYKKELPERLEENDIKRIKNIEYIYIYIKKGNKRDKIPIEEYNIFTSFFNNNTIEWLEMADINGLQNYKINKHNNIWKNYIKFLKDLYNNFRENILNTVVIDCSLTNMLNGIRISKDIDIVALPNKGSNSDKLYNYLEKKEKEMKNPELDIYFKEKKLWKIKTPEVLDKIANDHGEINYETYIRSNKYTYYFYGIKVITIYAYLYFVSERRYPKNIFDTIQAHKILNLTYPLKPLEDKIIVNEKVYKKNEFLKVVKNYYMKFINKKVNIEDIKKDLIIHNILYKKINEK